MKIKAEELLKIIEEEVFNTVKEGIISRTAGDLSSLLTRLSVKDRDEKPTQDGRKSIDKKYLAEVLQNIEKTFREKNPDLKEEKIVKSFMYSVKIVLNKFLKSSLNEQEGRDLCPPNIPRLESTLLIFSTLKNNKKSLTNVFLEANYKSLPPLSLKTISRKRLSAFFKKLASYVEKTIQSFEAEIEKMQEQLEEIKPPLPTQTNLEGKSDIYKKYAKKIASLKTQEDAINLLSSLENDKKTSMSDEEVEGITSIFKAKLSELGFCLR